MAQTLIPIIALILTGVLLKYINFVDENAISGIKKIASNVFLPVVVFNALALAQFKLESVFIMAISMFVLITAFGIGFVAKKLYKNKDYKDFIPFMSVTFENGMLGYALAEVLVGKDNLHYIATIDLSGAIFSFTIWIILLEKLSKSYEARNYSDDTKMDTGNVTDDVKKKSIIISMIKTPTLDAAVLGLIFGVSGLGNKIIESSYSDVYNNLVDMFTKSLTPVILICIGYTIHITKESILDSLVFIVQRAVVVACMLGIALLIFGRFIDFTKELTASIILYFCLPPSFLLSVYVKGKKGPGVMACILSIYMVITLIVFSCLISWM